MWQRVASAIFICVSLALTTAASTAVSAQESSVVTSPAVTAAPAPEQVRFISFDKITHLRLEVFSPTGERVFDSDFKSGDLLDWRLQDQQGQRLADGSYLCVVTVKELSGRLSQRHGSVSLRERQVSLQRVAPEQLSAGEARAWADSRATQALGAAQDSGDLSFIGEDAPASLTVTAHDGQNGQVTSTTGSLTFRTGDVLSGNDREQMRVTPEGRVGVGTADPQATLDVAGAVRAQDGIVFGDGTVLKSARDLRNTEIVGVNANVIGGTPTLNVSGTGTAGKISKWMDGAGTLGDSALTESGGKVGIGTATPAYGLHLVGGSLVVDGAAGFNFGNADFAVRSASGNGFWDFAVSNANGSFLMFDAVGSKTPLTIEQGAAANSIYISRPNGFVGFGTNAPTQKVDVFGNLKITGAGNGVVFPDGTKQTTAGGGGGGVSGSGTTGVLPLWLSPTALDNSVITQSAGNIGIGTTGSGSRLTVAGVIESTAGGIRFPDGTVQTTTTVQGPAGPTGPTGPQGPQGATGPQGPAGPAGPAVHTFAVCVDGAIVNGSCQPRTCFCNAGTVGSTLSPCRVTSDTGTCIANSCYISTFNQANGQCCVCRP